MYRLTWRSVMCLPDNQGSPAIAGGTLIETAQAAHLTGHPNCRQAAIVIVAADAGGAPDPTRIASQFDDGFGSGLHQGAVAGCLVAAQGCPQLLGDGDGDVEVGWVGSRLGAVRAKPVSARRCIVGAGKRQKVLGGGLAQVLVSYRSRRVPEAVSTS